MKNFSFFLASVEGTHVKNHIRCKESNYFLAKDFVSIKALAFCFIMLLQNLKKYLLNSMRNVWNLFTGMFVKRKTFVAYTMYKRKTSAKHTIKYKSTKPISHHWFLSTTSENNKKPSGFLMLLGGLEKDQLHEIG